MNFSAKCPICGQTNSHNISRVGSEWDSWSSCEHLLGFAKADRVFTFINGVVIPG